MKSNGKVATPEFYGAKVEVKQESPSAAHIRSKELKNKHRDEKPRPPRRYDFGNTVYIPRGTVAYYEGVRALTFTKGLIVGVEWGWENSFVRKDIWCYWIKDSAGISTSQAFLVREDQISDRISL